jgi:hypothetical protein
LNGRILIDSLNRYIIHLGCPPQRRARARTCSETMVFIYDAVYKLISRKCPDSLESRSVKFKQNGNHDIMGMEDAQTRKKMLARNETRKVCTFIIIILILDSRMVFG